MYRNTYKDSYDVFEKTDVLESSVARRKQDMIDTTKNESIAIGTQVFNAMEVSNGLPINASTDSNLPAHMRHRYKITTDMTEDPALGNLFQFPQAASGGDPYYRDSGENTAHYKDYIGTTKEVRDEYKLSEVNNLYPGSRKRKWEEEARTPYAWPAVPFPDGVIDDSQLDTIYGVNERAFYLI